MTRPDQDPSRLAAALALPVAAIYQRSGLAWQKLTSLCGPTSIANVLRSLGDPVERPTLRVSGMTLDQMARAVHDQSARRATILRDLSLDDFRAQLERTNDPARRYIVNFHRGALFGWGGGHHSPVAGYLAADDLALVLDVNRRVGPWLVSPERLHAAVSTVDPSARRRRGLLLVE